MSELVHGEHLAPRPELADALAWVGRRRPEHDQRMIEQRERKTVRDIERVFDHDLNSLRRRVTDEPRHRRVDGGQARGDELRPIRQLRWILDVEAAGVDRTPVEPRTLEELR